MPVGIGPQDKCFRLRWQGLDAPPGVAPATATPDPTGFRPILAAVAFLQTVLGGFPVYTHTACSTVAAWLVARSPSFR